MLRSLFCQACLGILVLVASAVDSFAAAKPNIVLITLDSVRADRMGPGSRRGSITPSLDRVALQGVVFAQAYAQAPLTAASHATILTGVYPQVHRAGDFGIPLAAEVPYLPDLLHAAGYRTAAFVGSIELDPRNGPFQGYDRGFDVYDAAFHQAQRSESRYQSVERHGDEVVARATKWLPDNKQQPFFLWVNLHDAAADSSLYDRAAAKADSAVGKLIAFLRAQSLYDDSVILIASPHGESLGAHGEDAHGIFLYDETIHVPLVLKLPKNQMAGKQVRNRVRLLDVAPTLLEAVGIPIPSQMQGQSLMRVAQSSTQADQPAYARSELPESLGCAIIESWRAGKYLYIRAPKPELYDVAADPGANHNLVQSSKATLETIAAQLQSFDQRLSREAGKPSETALTSSEMQKLASLGYVGLQKSAVNVDASTQGVDPKDVIVDANKILAALRDIDDGKPEAAIAGLKQLTARTNVYLAEYGWGAVLFQQQQYAEAIPHLHKAIELQPDSPWAHYLMGLSLTKTGDFNSAAVHLEIASKRLPEFVSAHSALADAYKQMGRTDSAAQRPATSQREQKKHD